jgi:hypothetical protein
LAHNKKEITNVTKSLDRDFLKIKIETSDVKVDAMLIAGAYEYPHRRETFCLHCLWFSI